MASTAMPGFRATALTYLALIEAAYFFTALPSNCCHAEARSICFIGVRCFVPQHDMNNKKDIAQSRTNDDYLTATALQIKLEAFFLKELTIYP